MQSKLLLAATAATGAVAIDLSGNFPHAFRRAVDLAPRDEAQCAIVAAQNSAVLEDFPMMPTGAELDSIPTLSDPCSFPTVTGSAGSVVTSYSSALESWKDAHVTELRSIWQACSDAPAFSSVIAQYGSALCSTVLVEITSADASNATGTATATATGTVSVTETGTVTATDATVTESGSASGTASGEASASGEAASTTASPAAAPKETGLFVAAAAAAAGIVGAVML
ncbi:hypothetical protein CkaCkLH20_09273 [Colletotrichum karsti]|uniref:Infection structure specific protein n=1 Tax=Colletotrichum karsti TaxID=1095194 RepID=A0A9P6HZP5_9PEZI|nr:uncharacterized protein CkaCkLH20_09273 [Colletotrichum karsti]KAF9873110.1 hypothetical protein CkaCkLH20_09273 [Colletotrichum karsti]